MREYFVLAITFMMTFIPGPRLFAQVFDEWPAVIETERGKVTVYQPQIESFQENDLSARAAISVLASGADNPVFGAIWLDMRVVCDRKTRICGFEDIQIPIIRFPESEDGSTDIEMLRLLLEEELPKFEFEISLDRLLASIEDLEQKQALAGEFRNEAPEIIFTKEPAMLVIIDGEPRLKEYDKHFQRVINSPYYIVRQNSDQRYYLYGDGNWYSASDIKGAWTFESKPPRQVRKLGKELEKEQQQQQKQDPETSDDILGGSGKDKPETVASIILRTTPAELIVADGEPEFTPIKGTDLLYMSNTESMVFMNIKSQQYFAVFSGRWYRSGSIEGPWTYVPSDELPGDFADIPEGSERDLVLSYVAGTEAAKEAVVDAYIPETATIDRNTVTTEVEYDGPPQFERIPNTNLEYAINTASTVLKSGNRFYAVDNGVWFESTNANGPWTVAVERPEGVDEIPPSSPAYNVKYVYIYDYTPDVVYVGYTPGYTGCYVYGPTIVYGTGWYYRPWYGTYYYPRHWTWGFHMQYNPWYGWSFTWSTYWGRPWGWYYPPYYRPPYYGYRPPYYGGWWGPSYYRPPVHYPSYHNSYYGPRAGAGSTITRPGTRPVTRPATTRPATRPANIYDQLGNRGVKANEVRPVTRPQPGTQPSTRPRPTPDRRPQPETRPAPKPGQTAPTRKPRNDVYTDPSGNIYRRGENGQWQTRDRGQWQPMPSTRDRSQIQQYQNERLRGQQRTQSFNQYQRQTMPSRQRQTSPQPRRRGN